MVRKAGNRGSFYPYSCEDTKKLINNFNQILEKSSFDRSIFKIKPKAIISPHAGFIYSGFTANVAHRLIPNKRPQRVIVVGPSHHIYFEGISVAINDYYETPCGNILIDKDYIKKLKLRFDNLLNIPEAHYLEHSTETQMPFIRYYEPNSKILEIIYSFQRNNYKELVKLLDFILKDDSNVVVISSDLSHFYSLEDAKRLDNICLAGVAQKDTLLLDKGCEACGIVGIKAIVEIAKARDFNVKLLDYRTSADTSGDTKRVVGYMSAVFY